MKDDTQIIDLLREHEPTSYGLDAGRVIAGAKRRRARNRLTVTAALAVTTAMTVTGVVAAGGLPSRESSQPAQVAGVGEPSATSKPTAVKRIPQRAPDGQPVKWTPGGPIGAQPTGTIPASGKVKVAAKAWFETMGTKWCLTTLANGVHGQPFGCRGTVGNTNLGDETAPTMASTGMGDRDILITSVFRSSDAHRVIYTDNLSGKYYEGKLYRLAGIPGWMLSIGEMPWDHPKTDDSTQGNKGVFVYDENGDLIFPVSENGEPVSHPLQQQ